MKKMFKIIGNTWFALVGIALVSSILYIFYRNGFTKGYDVITTVFSPFNIANVAIGLAALAPGLLFTYLSDR